MPFISRIWRGRSVFDEVRIVICDEPKCLFMRGQSVLTRGKSIFSKKGAEVVGAEVVGAEVVGAEVSIPFHLSL